MEQMDIESLAIKLGMFAAGLKELGDHLAQQSQQAAQDLERSSRSLSTMAEQTARSVCTRLEATASKAVLDGTRTATQEFEQSLLTLSRRLGTTASALDARLTSAGRLHVSTAWKGFLTAGFAAVFAVAAACTLTWQTLTHVQDSDWWNEVQRARAHGTLQPCPEGGVCVYANKRWHRLAH